MSQMTFKTQQDELLGRLRLNDNTTHRTLVKRWLNQAQQEIWAAYDWPWAYAREVVQTVLDKSTGTVSVAAGGKTVTGSGTAFASSDIGRFIQFSSSDDWYKITAVAGSTSLTIEADYVGTSALSGGTFTIRTFFYSLSSAVEKVLSMRQMVTPAKLRMVHFRQFDIFVPKVTSTGDADRIVPWGYDSSGNWTFSLYPTPDQVLNLEVRYKKKATDLSADGDVSDIPEKWHSTVMQDGALYRGYEFVRTSDNDRRAELKRRDFLDGIEKMIRDADPESDEQVVIRSREQVVSFIGPRLPDEYGAQGR